MTMVENPCLSPLFEEMEERIIQALHRVWDMIGGDVLTCIAEEQRYEGKSTGKYNAELPGNHVAEIVGDADHMRTYGDDDKAVEFYYSLSWDQRSALRKKAFPSKFKYCW
jgi:hypothetical protein